MPTTGQRPHWSIDYDTARQGPHFGNALRAALGSWPPGAAGDGAVRRYDLLPNYAAGWRHVRLAGGGALRIGGAEIIRRPEPAGGAHYRVRHDNATSGEQVTLDFHTALPRAQPAAAGRRRRCALARRRLYRVELLGEGAGHHQPQVRYRVPAQGGGGLRAAGARQRRARPGATLRPPGRPRRDPQPGRRPGPGGDPGRAARRARCRRAPPRKATTRSRRTTRGSRSVGRPPPRTLAGSPAVRASQWRVITRGRVGIARASMGRIGSVAGGG